MNREDLAWAAGFFDGDGSIGIYIKRRKYRNRDYPLPEIYVRNTELPLIRQFQDLFGGHITVHKRKKPHKTYYEWTPFQRDLLEVALVLAPYLKSSKKQKAFEVIKYYT